MRSALISASLFATAALAAVQPAVPSNCFTSHSSEVAEFSDCGDRASLAACLSKLTGPKKSPLESCYVQAGCSEREAGGEASLALNLCSDLASTGELRRRYEAVAERADTTTAAAGKLQCLVTKTVSTTLCPISTGDNGKLTTASCTPTEVASTSCSPGLVCSHDNNGNDICMELRNGLDTGGIVVSIVFGSAIILAIGFLTFMCCKESRDHKRAAARAEATALTRAATKKQRSQEVRAPLMRQQDGPPGAGLGGPDPFHDRNQS